MNNDTRNALEVLKRAVLLVLYEETDAVKSEYPRGYPSGRILKAGQVRERLDIPKPEFLSVNPNSLIRGILDHLRDDGHAYHYVDYGWTITEKGVKAIEG